MCTIFTLYVFLPFHLITFFAFFACVLCPLSNLRFPDNIQLSTARTTSNSEISGPFMDINITSFHVLLDMLIFSLVFCLFIQEKSPFALTRTTTKCQHDTQEYQYTVDIIFIFIQNVHVNIINFFYFQLGYT